MLRTVYDPTQDTVIKIILELGKEICLFLIRKFTATVFPAVKQK